MSRRSFGVAASEAAVLFESFTKEFDEINEREMQRNKRLSDEMEGQKQLIESSAKRARQLREQGRNRELALAQERKLQEEELQRKLEADAARLQNEAKQRDVGEATLKDSSAVNASSTSTAGDTDSRLELFPHAMKCKKDVQSVERLQAEFSKQGLSPSVRAVVSACEDCLATSMSQLREGTDESFTLTDDVFAPLCRCVRDLSKVIQLIRREDPKSLTKLLLTLFDSIITSAVSLAPPQVPSEEVRDQCILAHTVLVLGLFRDQPANLANQFSVIFRGLLFQKASVLLPVFGGNNPETSSVSSVAAVKFFASLCSAHAMSPFQSPLSAEIGWKWLSCVHHEIKSNDALVVDAHATIARTIIYFLSFAGSYLFAAYGTEFAKLLKSLHDTVAALMKSSRLPAGDMARDWKGLQGYLARVVTAQFLSSRCLCGVEPYAIQGYFIKCYTDDLRVMAQQIDETNKEAGKGVRFSVRKAFNQLDVTVESAYGVVDSLLNYIQGAASNREMLDYTLDRIAMLLLDRTRSINVTAEGHIAKLARVACDLCHREPKLTELLKSQFYYACPLVFPGYPSSSIQREPDRFRQEFGFVMKTVTVKDSSKPTAGGEKDGDQVWETDDDWMDRMGKMLAVFAEIVCSDYQTPFSIDDGWAWLANFVNSAATHSGAQPFFIAETLDIFLRVTGPTMMNHYKSHFLRILKMIQSKIVPQLQDEGSRKVKNSIERLGNVLDGALKNNPPVFLSIVNISKS